MNELNNFPKAKTKPAFVYEGVGEATTTFAGGKPFVNEQYEFPMDKDGEALRFFCQIDLSDVDERIQEVLSLPSHGFLQFYNGAEDVFGMDFDNDDFRDNVSRILYLEEAYDDESFVMPEIGEFPEDTTPLMELGERSFFKGKYAEMLPFPNSLDNPGITEEDKYGESYMEFYEFVNEPYYELWLGGYPHFTQWDFRKKDNEWELLLGSESGENILWGDSGAGGFWVPRSDLQKQDYSRSAIFWDCL